MSLGRTLGRRWRSAVAPDGDTSLRIRRGIPAQLEQAVGPPRAPARGACQADVVQHPVVELRQRPLAGAVNARGAAADRSGTVMDEVSEAGEKSAPAGCRPRAMWIADVLHLQGGSRRETCSHLDCSFGAEFREGSASDDLGKAGGPQFTTGISSAYRVVTMTGVKTR